MAEMARFVRPLLGEAAPSFGGLGDPRGLLSLASFARRFAALPEPQQTAFIQLLTMSSADFVSQWFESEPLRATLSASGIIGTFLSPRTPGSAYILLHHYLGEVDGEYRAWGQFAASYANAVARALREPTSVVVVGRMGDAKAEALWRAARSSRDPDLVALHLDPGVAADAIGERGFPIDRTAAYVCVGTACSAPLADEGSLRRELEIARRRVLTSTV
jgi:phytoene dehydrogenase-like protein